ncbi:hypothetical protein ABPG75_005365 [Micractinium tetrahymenae]
MTGPAPEAALEGIVERRRGAQEGGRHHGAGGSGAAPQRDTLAALISGIIAGEQRSAATAIAARAEAALAAGLPLPPHRLPPAERATYPQPPPCAFLRPGLTFEGRQRVSHSHHGSTVKQEHWEVQATIQVDKGKVSRHPLLGLLGERVGNLSLLMLPWLLSRQPAWCMQACDRCWSLLPLQDGHSLWCCCRHEPGSLLCLAAPLSVRSAALPPAPLRCAALQHYDPSSGYIAGTMEAANVPDALEPVCTFFEGEIIDNVNHTFYTADWDACADTDFLHWSKFPPFRELHAEVVKHGGRCPSLAAHSHVFMRWKEQFFLTGSECRLTIAGFYYLACNRKTGEVLGWYFDPSSSPDQKLNLAVKRAGPAGWAFPHYELA